MLIAGRRTGGAFLRSAAGPARIARAPVRGVRRAAGRPARRDHASSDTRGAGRGRPRRGHGPRRPGRADRAVLGSADRLARGRVRSRDLAEDTRVSLRRPVRAVQDRDAHSEAADRAFPTSRCCSTSEVVERDADRRRGDGRRRAAPDGVTTHTGVYLIGADGGRSTVRKQSGHFLRGLHVAGAVPRAHDAVRLRGARRLLPAVLLRRPGGVVQLFQGVGQRAARALADRVSHQSRMLAKRS